MILNRYFLFLDFRLLLYLIDTNIVIKNGSIKRLSKQKSV